MRWIVVIFLVVPAFLFGQDRCGTDLLPENINRPESTEQLQNWISNRVKSFGEQPAQNRKKASYTVPVVFHVIHNGEPIGSGSNLSDARITQQLEILNEDFRRQNPDVNLTPQEFLPVAADTEINFVMASRDPEGLPTSGITRTQGPLTSYSDDASVITSIIQWPPEDVVNIYIVPLNSSLGFAKFPFSNLAGMDSRFNGYREVDGIFINYRYTGISNDPTLDFESRGRTVTHEMGHYFGLVHIFSGCGLGDYCDDTPSQSGSTHGCPESKIGCEVPAMFQNYLDYTDDACMNLFTLDQKDRMQAVLSASPRRSSLTSSPLLQSPVYVANDLGIRSIESPKKMDCSADITPQIEVRNYGSNPITSFEVDLYINDQFVSTRSSTVTLGLLDTHILSFTSMELDEEAENTIRFLISEVNGGADGNAQNNQKFISLPPAEADLLPYLLDFESSVVISAETELGTPTAWTFGTAPYNEATNQAIMLPFYGSTTNFGIKDFFLTDLIDVSNLTSLQLTFHYAYAGNPSGNFLDGLIVAISRDCGETFSYNDYAFERYGASLQTASTTESFVPIGPVDWEEISINLTQFLNGSSLQLAFIGVNGGGNNLYIDHIELTSGDLRALDIGIREVVNISPVTCRTKVFPEISVKNFGYTTVNSFSILIDQDGEDTVINYIGQSIVSGETEVYSNTSLDLKAGENNLTFVLQNLNGLGDEYQPNDTLRIAVIMDNSSDVLPLKETFDTPDWQVNEVSGTEPIFSIDELRRNQILRGSAYDSGLVGSQTFIVSPTFQTGSTTEAAVRFRYSYAERPGFNDNLQVYLSNDCGSNFSFKLMDWDSDELSVVQSLDPWEPAGTEDWKTGFVDISEYLIWGSLRVGFVFTNGNGNNLYLDDLEVILNNDPNLPVFEQRFEVYPIPAVGKFNVALNLPEKESIRIRLIDMSGKAVMDEYFPNTLNQTYEFIAPSQRGYYLLQVIGEQVYQYRRIFIDQ